MHQSLECPTPKSWGRCGRKKCRPCMNWRRMQWIYRLKQEALVSERAWFLTLTYSSNPTLNQSRDLWQKYMKTVRKSLTAKNVEPSKRQIRYFTVSEIQPKSGKQHLHSLIFCAETLRRRDLENHWHHGFSNCKLVRPTHIQYVAKYLGKDTHRIMASQLLGLREGIASEKGHPTWYRRMRYERLMRQGIKPMQVITANPNPSSDAEIDCMERQDAPHTRRSPQTRPTPTTNVVSEACVVAEGACSSPRRREGGSADV